MNRFQLEMLMSEIDARAFVPTPLGAISRSARARAAATVNVEIADGRRLAALQSEWNELIKVTDCQNIFLNPGIIRAVSESDRHAEYLALLAWKPVGEHRKLVGVWAFSRTRPPRSALPFQVLTAPLSKHSYLATPVIDRDYLDDTLDCMLDAVADVSSIANILALDMMATEGQTYDALVRVVGRRGGSLCIIEESQRPKLASDLDGKTYLQEALSSSTRKKLRQYRRRLSEQGALSYAVAAEPDEIKHDLESFLVMEAAGWKGSQGTALLSDAAAAQFMRQAVAVLAETGSVAIHSLRLDGKPVSMQIIARCGTAAFTWKTAYDERFREFSPGVLLLEDYTNALLADKSIAFADSCSFDDSSFMSAWQQRQPMAEIWVNPRRGVSLSFLVLSRAQRAYRQVRTSAKAAIAAWAKRSKQKAA